MGVESNEHDIRTNGAQDMTKILSQDELKEVAVTAAYKAHEAVMDAYKAISGPFYNKETYQDACEHAFAAYDATFWATAAAVGYNRV